jgi:hypothetical protein
MDENGISWKSWTINKSREVGQWMQLGSWKNEIQKLQSKIIGQTMDLRKWDNEWTCESFAEVGEQMNLVKWNNGWTHESETLANRWTWGSRQWIDSGKLDNRLMQGRWTIDELKKLGKMELEFNFWTFMDFIYCLIFSAFSPESHFHPLSNFPKISKHFMQVAIWESWSLKAWKDEQAMKWFPILFLFSKDESCVTWPHLLHWKTFNFT